MNEETAMDVLGLQELPQDKDDLIDQIEEQVFPIREYFLRNPVVSILYQKRMRQLERIAKASTLLGAETEASTDNISFHLKAEGLTALLKGYEEVLMQARLRIASTMQPKAITSIVSAMLDVQDSYESQFMALTADLEEADESIKASEHLETGVLLLALRNDDQAAAEGMIRKERKRINAFRRLKHPS